MPSSQTPNKYTDGFHQRKRLPHYKRENATYFVTYRLADSFPQKKLLTLKAELLAQKSASTTAQQREEFRVIETYLDKGIGSCCLQHPPLASLIADNLQFFNRTRYTLYAWVVMPNHIHVLLHPHPPFSLGKIIQSWKQFTSRRAKQLLPSIPSPFWQRESYDHLLRNSDDKTRIISYIHRNPVKARLCATETDWPWSSAGTSTNTHQL